MCCVLNGSVQRLGDPKLKKTKNKQAFFSCFLSLPRVVLVWGAVFFEMSPFSFICSPIHTGLTTLEGLSGEMTPITLKTEGTASVGSAVLFWAVQCRNYFYSHTKNDITNVAMSWEGASHPSSGSFSMVIPCCSFLTWNLSLQHQRVSLAWEAFSV